LFQVERGWERNTGERREGDRGTAGIRESIKDVRDESRKEIISH
jgi:hypothetical protein